MILRKKRASLEIATDCNDDFGAASLRYEVTDHGPNPEIHYAQNEEESILKKAIQSLRPTLRVKFNNCKSARCGKLQKR
jgi:hypothetical protein